MSITVEEVIGNLAEAFDLRPSACEEREASCRCYELSPEYGRGQCRFFLADAHLGLAVMDFVPARDVELPDSALRDTFISFYRSVSAEWIADGVFQPLQEETLYTNACRAHGVTRFHAGARVRGFVLFLDPEQIFSFRTGMRDAFSGAALAQLNNLSGVSELLPILHQIENCPIKESAEMREVYYSAKIYELLALCMAAAQDARRPAVHTVNVTPEDRESIAALTRFIDENLAGELDQTALANRVHMSKSKLKYTFKAVTGVTMTEYRSQHREQRACELLRQTQMPIADIASALGFSGTSSFSRFFKTRLSVTPMDYRQSLNVVYA